MKRIILAVFILVTFSGCYLKSVHPLVEQKEAVLIPELQGTWIHGKELWTFIHDPNQIENLDLSIWDMEADTTADEANEDPVYLVLVSDLDDMEKEPIALQGMITELNDQFFLDLTIFTIDGGGSDDLVAAHNYPVHTFSKIEVNKEEASISFFKSSWIKMLIEGNRVRIKHEKTGEDILITASTNELRKFVEKYGEDVMAFEDPISLTRTYEHF